MYFQPQVQALNRKMGVLYTYTIYMISLKIGINDHNSDSAY